MKKQSLNPYLPSYEYIPDGEPRVFGDRLYVFGSHDRFGGKQFCMNDYALWSAPLDDLADWKYEGIIYHKTQHPGNEDGKRPMYAPDVAQGPDGRYYLYYSLADDRALAVAVCDTPAGNYEFLGFVSSAAGVPWGQGENDFMPFDPGILVDEDGRIHLYAGQGPMTKGEIRKSYKKHFRNTAYHVELEPDMVTMKGHPTELLPSLRNSKATGYEGHEFFEANSIRRFNGTYYFIYSSVQCHELCYCMSDRPDRGFVFGGTLTSNGDIGLDGPTETINPKDGTVEPINQKKANSAIKYYTGNNHGSILKLGDSYYIFGHRHTGRSQFSRQGYADPITMTEDGHFLQAERTSCGLNQGPLSGRGIYEARIACQLYSAAGACFSSPATQNLKHPAITQSGEDREENPDQYIANMQDGTCAVFKYFQLGTAKTIGIRTRGTGHGIMLVTDAENYGKVLASIPVYPSRTWKKSWCDLASVSGAKPLYFRYVGKGSVDFMNFCLK